MMRIVPRYLAAAAVLLILLLTSACSEREPVQLAEAEAVIRLEPTALPTPEATPTAPVKFAAAQDKALPPAASPTAVVDPAQQPHESANLRIVDYDKPTRVAIYDPPVEDKFPTPEPPPACDQRSPDTDLFAIVTKEYGISADFAPDDLVPLADYLPLSVTVGYPSQVREVIIEPLVAMIDDMLAEGLQPWILSGYRSYAAQALSWDKWNRLYPDTAAIVSAQPGHSEHQLGTVVDFGSPELRGIVGQPDIEFHTYFIKTSEGQWLAQNAHKYGFTLSFTAEAFDTTGFYYEPWHYRYVGQGMAALLHEANLTLIEYKLQHERPPCTP